MDFDVTQKDVTYHLALWVVLDEWVQVTRRMEVGGYGGQGYVEGVP